MTCKALFPFLMALHACSAAPLAAKGVPGDPLSGVEPATLRNRAHLLVRRGEYLRAQQYLSAALADGLSAEIVVPEIVAVCVADSRLRAALGFARPYLRTHPEDGRVHYLAGVIYEALHQSRQAYSHLLQATESGDVGPEAFYFLAQSAREIGNLAVAQSSYEEFLRTGAEGDLYSAATFELMNLSSYRGTL